MKITNPVSDLHLLAILGSCWWCLALPTIAAEPARPLTPIAAKLEPARKLVYKSVYGRQLQLHVFEPIGHQPTDRRPAILGIHGGGWVAGEPRRFYPFAAFFARHGIVGISLEYRLRTPDDKTTVFDCVRDGRSAMRYLRQHADELGIAAHQIGVAGASAGGHIAIGTALFNGFNDVSDNLSVSCRPDLIVLYYPVIDTSPAGYGQSKIGRRWREISPVAQVRPNMAPTLIFHGTGDTVTPFAGAQQFHQQMIHDGNQCDLVTHPNGRHGYLIFDLQLFDQALARTAQFLRKQKFIAP